MSELPDLPNPSTPTALTGRRLIVVGAGSRTGRALARAASAAGAELVLAGPDPRKLEWTAGELSGPSEVLALDLAEERSIAEFAARAGRFDHLVSTAAIPANGPLQELEVADVQRAFSAKVIGPLLLAKHLAGQVSEDGSFTFFSGVAAWRPSPGRTVMATTNGALAFLVQALAVELAPVRVNAVSPGIVDTGSWDGLGSDKEAFLRGVATRNPARRVGSPEDLLKAVFYAIDNPYVTGTVLHVDGGGRLV
ncbi:NAD(P)-dependent dehydrogenase (short-subunit alcohol dehydrogenase family) [Streptomyces sp. 1114.5]|uniref:SDR family oxidoreductase n=1 Tax=unclassified Streptomyces TaxID=2593676 RepID=UPI000BDC3955|nr:MULTISPECIES: SDR family oxidoreductase [unclassified Streptomyces]RKT18974.1 NAD(P)-dependent dehydrogenase (short-subunit alcohol dehydrogenase family) [Streptomyces sp. 1114.5]SOB85173.1 NAD(P)-dependent dehydrogenase, short-chain alcohol dehydrogenase family [Streptomyces sp. 1331.2]